MQQPRGRRRTVAAVVLAACCLASCADGPSPVGGDESLISMCTPVPGTGPVVSADETLRNASAGVVTVDAVRLVDAEGLSLREASLVPIEDRTLLGTSPSPPSAPVWQERQPAVGAALAPGETWNLALTLDRDRQPSGFADVEVEVTADGGRSTVRLGYALTVTTERCSTSQG